MARRPGRATFYVSNGTFQSGGTLSVSFVLDTTNDLITAGTMTVSADGRNLTLTSPNNFDGSGYGDWKFDDGAGSLNLLIGSSVTAPAICFSGCAYGITTQLTLNNGNFADAANGGTISTSPVAPTPEPSSLLLLGTGVVGMARVARRRFLR